MASHPDANTRRQFIAVVADHMILMMRIAAVASWITIAILSVLPGHDRPHTGYSGNLEHAAAYFMSGVLTRWGFAKPRWWLQAAQFSVAAAGFEIIQIFIPGRSPGIDNWAASSGGALAGLLVGFAAARLFSGLTQRKSQV